MTGKMAPTEATSAVADAAASLLGEAGRSCLAVECVEAADLDRGDLVARQYSASRAFRRPFHRAFRRPFPIRSGRNAGIPHGFTDCGRRVSPTSLRLVEVWS